MLRGIRSRTEQLAAVTSAMSTFVETRNLNEAAGILLRAALNLTSSDSGMIAAVTARSGLRMLARDGQGPLIPGDSISDEESLRLTQVVSDGKPLVRFLKAGSRPAGMESAGRHFVGLPIGIRPEFVGVLGLERKSEAFEPADAEKIGVILQSARILCENFHEEERRQALEERRRRAEDALRNSEANFRTLIEHSPDVIMKIDPDATIRFINYTLPEYSVESVVGTKATAYLSEEDTRRYMRGIAQVVKSGKPASFEVSAVGPTQWTVRLVPIPKDEGLDAIMVIASNITELRRKNEELESVLSGTSGKIGEAFFASLVKHLAAACHVRYGFISEVVNSEKTRVRLRAMWSGEKFDDTFEYDTRGTPCAEAIGRGLAFYPCEVAAHFPEDRWLADNRIQSYLAIPIFDSEGDSVGHMGVMDTRPMDQHAEAILRSFAARAGAELCRLKAERDLRESRRSLNVLLENLPGMVYRCRNDRDWTVEFASEGALALTGYSADDFVNEKVSYGRQVIHPRDRTRVWERVQSALDSKKPFKLTYRIRTKQGKEKKVWEQGGGIFSTEGELLALEGFITDISGQRDSKGR